MNYTTYYILEMVNLDKLFWYHYSSLAISIVINFFYPSSSALRSDGRVETVVLSAIFLFSILSLPWLPIKNGVGSCTSKNLQVKNTDSLKPFSPWICSPQCYFWNSDGFPIPIALTSTEKQTCRNEGLKFAANFMLIGKRWWHPMNLSFLQ